MKILTEENKLSYIHIILDEVAKLDSIAEYAFKYILTTDSLSKSNKITILYKWLNSKLEQEHGCIEDYEMLLQLPTEYLVISSFPKLYLYTILVLYNVDVRFDYDNDKFYTDVDVYDIKKHDGCIEIISINNENKEN